MSKSMTCILSICCDIQVRRNYAISNVIHTIHRFKSSDWLKEGHLKWIIFDNVHIWKLIHVC